jgi:hypothetical protein
MSKRSTLETMVGETSKPSQKQKESAKTTAQTRFERIFSPSVPKAAIFSTRQTVAEEEETVQNPTPKQRKQSNQPKASQKPAQAVNPTVASFWKPLAYSGALALVLFGMSYLLKNPTTLFGEKAMTSLPATTNPAKSQDQANSTTTESTSDGVDAEEPTVFLTGDEPETEPIERPALVVADPASPDEATSETMTEPSSETPPVQAVKTQPKPIVSTPRVVKHKAKTRKTGSKVKHIRSSNSVKFYDTSGQLIGR